MKVNYHRRFRKQYRKLSLKQQLAVDRTLKKFFNNPRDSRLRNHPLKGSFVGERAISVTGDIRMVFQEKSNYSEVTFLRVGTHAQVYKNS